MAAGPLHRSRRGHTVDEPDHRLHIIYAIVLIVLAAVYAGSTWGLGRRWAHLVQGNRWLL